MQDFEVMSMQVGFLKIRSRKYMPRQIKRICVPLISALEIYVDLPNFKQKL